MATMEEEFIAGVELGGTSCVAAIASARFPTQILHRFETITADPRDTLETLCSFLKSKQNDLGITSYKALGIASFGPVDLHPSSKTYGFITTTPKQAWKNVNVVGGYFRPEFGDRVPIAFETDVNAPALAEILAIHDRRVTNVVYITVGTGVGVGVIANGAPVHGLMHPEAGHIIVPRMTGDKYPGCCSFKHELCVEGMINACAIAERTGMDRTKLETLPDSHQVWETVGYYLGALCLNITFVFSPEVIVLGGGVMNRKILYDITRRWFKDLLKEYIDMEKLKTKSGLQSYIRESVYGNDAGIIGALEVANFACKK